MKEAGGDSMEAKIQDKLVTRRGKKHQVFPPSHDPTQAEEQDIFH